jgi:hypothetical protein
MRCGYGTTPPLNNRNKEMNYFKSLAIVLTVFSTQTLAWTISAAFGYLGTTADTITDSPNTASFHGAFLK